LIHDLPGDDQVQFSNLLFHKLQMLYAIADHLSVMIAHVMPLQRLDDLGNSPLRTAFGKLRNVPRLSLAFSIMPLTLVVR
jgi:hypothetical protein